MAQVGQRQPLRALAEQPGRDDEDERAPGRNQDEQDQQQPEQRQPEPAEGRRGQPGPAAPGRRPAVRGRRHASAGGRDSGSGGSALGQRTMFASNHVLMLASREPQVYGLMVWVATLVSGGSPARGATPCST